MDPIMQYKINSYTSGYSPWGYYGDTNSQNPANNAVKKTKKDELIDAKINYQYQQKDYKSAEPEKMSTYAAGMWWGPHYFGATVSTLTQDRVDHGPAGNTKQMYQETEDKYSMTYAYPIFDNYLSGGISLNLNQKTIGNKVPQEFSQAGVDVGFAANNVYFENFSLGFGIKNYSVAQSINDIEFKPDTSYGLGVSYRNKYDISLAADYNQGLYSDTWNTSLHSKYDYSSSFLNLTPAVTYTMNSTALGQREQMISVDLGISKDIKMDRTVKKPFEIPFITAFTYDYQELNISQTTIPLEFKQVTITKEFSTSQQSWLLTVAAPPLNKSIAGATDVFCIFELVNENKNKFYFTQAVDAGSAKESISQKVNVPAGKYQVSSYYVDQNRSLLSPVYVDPDPKYIGTCYTIKESVIKSELTVPRKNVTDLYDIQEEYQRMYQDHSECFDYIQSEAETNHKLHAYGSINAIYVYTETIQKLQAQVNENLLAIPQLEAKIPAFEKQREDLGTAMYETNDEKQLSELNARYKEVEKGLLTNNNTILFLKGENLTKLEAIDNNKLEIAGRLADVNKLNSVAELVGLTAEEQIQVMHNYRTLFTERYKELQDHQSKGLKLGKISALNKDFYQFYGRSKDKLNKMVRADIQEQSKNLALNQTAIDTLVSGTLQKNSIVDLEKRDINDLKFGEKVVYLFPWHDTQKSKWLDKKGYLEVPSAKVETLKNEEYPRFIVDKAGLKGDKRLKAETQVKSEVKKYQTVWKDVYQPLHFTPYIKAGYGLPIGSDQTREVTIEAGLSVKGF